ncbi:MAG: polysaccharide biosynthesis tyrosine autokinase [Verrucomicrobiae bacterium]|nr:polysaccharide biosynthesis tyrosine autokinase [Verrucomicrobiae bacterium]
MDDTNNNEVKLHALDYWQVIRNRYGVILLAFFLVFMTAAVITYIMPREYLGRVRLQIQPVSQEYEVFRDNSTRAMITPAFIQTQFQIITSKETLYDVIEELQLVKKWEDAKSPADAYALLLDKLETEEVRGTDLIDIQIYHTDPEEAAQLANAIGAAYKNRRTDMETTRSNQALDTLNAQETLQEQKVEDARGRMIELMEKFNIVDLGGGVPAWAGVGDTTETGSKQIVMASKMNSLQAEQEISTIKTHINTLTGLEGERLIEEAVALNVMDSTISVFFPERQKLKVQLEALLQTGLGPNHPDIQSVKSQLEEVNRILTKGVESVKSSLQTRLQIAEDSLKSLEIIEADKKEESMDERKQYTTYVEAKRAYETQNLILTDMRQALLKEKVDLSLPKTPIIIHEIAEANEVPAKPRVPLQLALGAVVGIVFGIGLAFFLEYLDTSVKTLEDVERYLGVPVLAVIPKDVGVLHKQSGLSPDAEAYRILRTNIEFNRKSADANAITVVSGGAGEGKSTTLVNLAYICAQGGYNTLMIDGDLRRPKLHTFFDINNSVGLTNYLTTDLMLEDVILQTPIDNLYFMPSGILPADAAGILNSRRMSELIADVKNRFDLVLIDSPPILGVSDASVLASEVDLTMIVIQHRKLPRGMLIRVKQAIENVGGHLLGVVLNNVDVRSDSQYQYYTSYYTYYSPTQSEPRAKARPTEAMIDDEDMMDYADHEVDTASASSGKRESRPSNTYDDDDEY